VTRAWAKRPLSPCGRGRLSEAERGEGLVRENHLTYPPHPLALRRESPLPRGERVGLLKGLSDTQSPCYPAYRLFLPVDPKPPRLRVSRGCDSVTFVTFVKKSDTYSALKAKISRNAPKNANALLLPEQPADHAGDVVQRIAVAVFVDH
jgi:hypothetical protein